MAEVRSSSSGVLKHIVLVKAKPGTSQKDIDMFCKGMLDLKHKCKRADGSNYILEITGGKGNSPEGEMEGYTHGFSSTFASIEDRDYYVSHDKAKVDYVESVEHLWDAIIVFDFTPDVN